MQERGFTLFELVITLAIAAILLTIGIPNFSHQINNSRTKTTALDLMQAVQHARTLAVSHNRRATLLHQGKWEDGWGVFIDGNDNGETDGDEELVFTASPPQSVAIYANGPFNKYVSFIGTGESRLVGRANGGGFQAGTFRVCPKEGGKGYALILARSGRMRMESISEAECIPFT